MTENTLNSNAYAQEIVELVRGKHSFEELSQLLDDYHENDIAEALKQLNASERKLVYRCVGLDRMSEIFSYIEDVSEYVEELGIEKLADVIEHMDASDAIDLLDEMEPAVREEVIEHMETDAKDDIKMITSYEDDMIGSHMSTNYIVIKNTDSVKMAMKSLIRQAEKNDNINTIYVENEKECLYGAIELKDLIVAREYVNLEDLIVTSYPFVYADEQTSDCIDKIRDYEEDSIPVLDRENHILGVITATDMVEMVDDEMSDDYAKLAGLTEQSDLKETVRQGMIKRLPWLILLLFLGMGVSSVVGIFESVVSQIALVVCFQSLILDMAGNVGTQSLAVTIRVLMDEDVKAKEKFKFVCKELQIGLSNGLLLGTMSFLCIGIYVLLVKKKTVFYSFAISGCVGISLIVAMVVSSLVGTLVPMLFHKMKIDPAVASGPLITTINDLVAVVTYYGLANLLLVQILQF